MRNISRMIMTVIPAVLLAGCDAQFRYPCQDPANWDQPECKLPQCQVDRSCPEHIFGKENLEKMRAAQETKEKR